MIIDVWSDVVCPWCFIGKRRLDRALAQFDHRDQVLVRHRAFQLQPNVIEIMPTTEHLAAKYQLSTVEVEKMVANVCSVAEGEGLCYNLEETLTGNTFDAHRALAFAATLGKQGLLLEEMYSAYFERALPLFTHQDICKVALGVEIDAAELTKVLETDAYSEQVLSDRKVASELGARGVPFFLIDRKYGISGAQPIELLSKTLITAWNERS